MHVHVLITCTSVDRALCVQCVTWCPQRGQKWAASDKKSEAYIRYAGPTTVIPLHICTYSTFQTPVPFELCSDLVTT